MNKIIKIAVDAMGGDGSPKKVVDGIVHHFINNKNSFYQIFGDRNKILSHIKQHLPTSSFEVIHTTDIVRGTDSPLEGAKRGKNTSMWLAIQSVRDKKSGEYRLSHHLDLKTGMYRGRQVLDPKD